MREVRWLALIALMLVGITSAHAHAVAENNASTALSAFVRVCMETHSDRTRAIERLNADGWSSATVSEIPASRRSRRGPVFVQIEGEPPADSAVFVGRANEEMLMVVQLATADRGEGRDVYRASTCRLYALGVTPDEMARVLFPENVDEQRIFVAAPIAFSQANGRNFTAGVSRTTFDGPYSEFGTFAFFDHEARLQEQGERGARP
jgi:hypothetical protein